MKQYLKYSLFIFLLNMPLLAATQPLNQSKLDYALQIIKYAYVDTVNEKKLNEEAIRAMLKTLDPHSVYIAVEELREMNEPLVGKFEGIGIQFNIFNDTIMVTQTIAGGPSEKIGLRQGDRIVTIDGETVAGIKITNNDVLKKLRGNKGTKVKVGIKRRGNEDLIDYTITRDQIPLFSVDANYMVAPKTGYIKISRFADATVDEFKEALKKLKQQGMENLVLDLQGNGGGYLNRAYELADEFIGEGKKIVYTKGRNTPSETFTGTVMGGFESGKLAILIDEGSASASEIVSGAVQDWDRGLIVGRRSFGKGLVQKPYQLPDGSMMRITVAHYYTPSGRCIQKPYSSGDDEAYEFDLSNRYRHGELINPDSIVFTDSTLYYTSNKRVVRGGGGIMPDVFVPLDTTPFSTFYSDLLRKGAFGDFVIDYVDKNRNQLRATYTDLKSFRNSFQVEDKLLEEFLTKAYTLKVAEDSAGLATSNRIIRLQLKALVARELWNLEGYFEVINEINYPLQRAIAAIQDDTYIKMKLAGK